MEKKIEKQNKYNKDIMISICALIISAIALFFSIIYPLFNKANIEFIPVRKLSVNYGFCNIQFSKSFSVTNTGDKETIVNSVVFYIIPANKEKIFKLTETLETISPYYANNANTTQVQPLNGFSLWPNSGYKNDLYFSKTQSQEDLKNISKIKEDISNQMKSKNIDPVDTDNAVTFINSSDSGFKLSNDLQNQIEKCQYPYLDMTNPGSYYLCEKIKTTNAGDYFNVYRFYISNEDFNQINEFTIKRYYNNYLLHERRPFTLDLEIISKQDKSEIVKLIKKLE